MNISLSLGVGVRSAQAKTRIRTAIDIPVEPRVGMAIYVKGQLISRVNELAFDTFDSTVICLLDNRTFDNEHEKTMFADRLVKNHGWIAD